MQGIWSKIQEKKNMQVWNFWTLYIILYSFTDLKLLDRIIINY